MNGSEILSKYIGSKQYSLDIASVPAGIYLISLESENGKIFKTMIKE
jgi:hypothetical protein